MTRQLPRRHPPSFEGDFPDGESVTEAIERIPPAWDARGIPFRGTGRVGLPAAPPPRLIPQAAPAAPAAPADPAWQSWLQPVVTVTVAAAGAVPDSDAAARLQAALTYLRLKVAILTRRGRLDRIADDVLAMTPALPNGHTAKTLVREAADLLTRDREPWEPMPWQVDMSRPQPWARPAWVGAR